jgi:acyl carrier protein
MDDLILKLKREIITALKLEGMRPEDIETDAPLFNEGLGLDSIHALGLIVLLDKNYGIVIEDAKLGKQVLESLRTMAEYIQQNKKT